ncbi:MAG: hypothetical protein LQ341_003691 [Variospora aurantia]|nr:MAG: hypothetical protein LQ341_003691 [Variospora aurantia]
MVGYESIDDDTDSLFGQVPEVRPLVRDGPQSRYVRGARPQCSIQDLRPPPLRYNEKSLIDILKEGPPENYGQGVSPCCTTGSATDRSKSVTPKKSHSIGRSSLATVRKFLSASPKQKDESHRPKHIPIVTAQNAFNMPSPTSSQLSEQFSPWFAVPANVSNAPITPPLSRTTTNSAGFTATQLESSTQRSLHRDGTPTKTSSNHKTRGASTSYAQRSQIYGQPPAAMISPVIPRKVTGEHLSLASFPPVSREDIAKLPKEIEPTLPSPEMSRFAWCHRSQQTSSHQASINSPTVEAFSGPRSQTWISNFETNIEDRRVFKLSALPASHQRPDYCTYSIQSAESVHMPAETKFTANSTALARIQEDNVTMIGSSFENPRPAPRPNVSSQTALHKTSNDVITPSMAKLKGYFAICTPESIYAARLEISSEDERLERLALIRHLTGTADCDIPNGRAKHPNHDRQHYARNLWCTHHTQSCSLCDTACCVMMEVLEVESEATDVYCRNLAKEAGDLMEACAEPSDDPTFLQCGACDQIKCKPRPWEPCAAHNLI